MNCWVIEGNIGSDPEIIPFDNGDIKAIISVATDEGHKDRETGDWVKKPTWHRIKFSGSLAKRIKKQAKSGMGIAVKGSKQVDVYNNSDGEKQYDHYMKAEWLNFTRQPKP